MNDRLTIITKRMLDIMFYIGIVILVLLPAIIYIFSKYNNYYKNML